MGNRVDVVSTGAIPLLNDTSTKQFASWSTVRTAKAMVEFQIAI